MSSRTIPYGVWLHVTAMWDQGLRLAKMFINGTIAASKGAEDGSYELRSNSHSFYQIGKKEDSGDTFYGLVRKLKIFKGVLSGNEILTEINGM